MRGAHGLHLLFVNFDNNLMSTPSSFRVDIVGDICDGGHRDDYDGIQPFKDTHEYILLNVGGAFPDLATIYINAWIKKLSSSG